MDDSLSSFAGEPGKFMPLPFSRSFYAPSARVVAPRLLGHWLIARTERGFVGGLIVETEAYLANDPACHAYRGFTQRNRSMWGSPGCAYVYFIYGNHFCFNAVCRPIGVAEAVLLRAIEPQFGEARLCENRRTAHRHQMTNGPAKLCQAMNLDRRLDGVDLCDLESPVFIARNPDRRRTMCKLGPIAQTPRIGITKAVELPLRFYLRDSHFVSRKIETLGEASSRSPRC